MGNQGTSCIKLSPFTAIKTDVRGTEELLAEIAAVLQQPVAVSEVRSSVMRLAGVPESAYAVERGGDRLRVLPRWQVTLDLVARLNRLAPTVAIIPSGKHPHSFMGCSTKNCSSTLLPINIIHLCQCGVRICWPLALRRSMTRESNKCCLVLREIDQGTMSVRGGDQRCDALRTVRI